MACEYDACVQFNGDLISQFSDTPLVGLVGLIAFAQCYCGVEPDENDIAKVSADSNQSVHMGCGGQPYAWYQPQQFRVLPCQRENFQPFGN